MKAMGAGGLGEFADDVAVGTHLGCVPGGNVRGVHGEAVAVLGDGDDVTGAGLLEEIHPGVGVEVLGFEHGDEVLVAEPGLGAVSGDVVLVGFVSGGRTCCGSTTRFRMPERSRRPSGGRCRTWRPEPGGGTVLGEGVQLGAKGADLPIPAWALAAWTLAT